MSFTVPVSVRIGIMPVPTTEATERSEAMIDEALASSFPASDPPYWTLGIGTDRFEHYHGVPRN